MELKAGMYVEVHTDRGGWFLGMVTGVTTKGTNPPENISAEITPVDPAVFEAFGGVYNLGAAHWDSSLHIVGDPGSRVHRAMGRDGETCTVCGMNVHRVQGGQGTVLVHTETGAVLGRTS